ncbi:MAG: hypothetical protein OXC18_18620 [Desulfurellaceae bacterium]|nr:hypothetical protein [Desulfurellaceae bacterium]
MQPTGVVINRESWLLLREEPVYSVRFIDREGTQELAVVSRVEDLDWFIEAPLPLTLRLSTWQSPEQIWVVAIGYQLHPTFGGSKGGVFYLNPRQASDAALLHKLVRQDKLTVILLSDDTELHYTVSVPLSPPQLERWQAAVARLGLPAAGALSDAEEDPAFDRALRAFQEQYGPDDVLEEN